MRNAEEILKDGRTHVSHKTTSSRIAILSPLFIDNFFPRRLLQGHMEPKLIPGPTEMVNGIKYSGQILPWQWNILVCDGFLSDLTTYVRP